MLQRAQAIQDQLTKWRRTFHQHPEVGFAETLTAALVADELRKLGLRVETGVGKTGVVGHLGSGSPCVALRADMDALPLQEANAVPYASQVPGVMHACGHDAHTAILLGVATLLAQVNRESPLPGEVRFLFQPSEEAVDEEDKSGAMRMVEDGAAKGIDIAFALHVSTEYRTGDIKEQFDAQLKVGMTMAEIEKKAILMTLDKTNWNRSKAAEVLGIGLRTLQRKLKEYKGEGAGPEDEIADEENGSEKDSDGSEN